MPRRALLLALAALALAGCKPLRINLRWDQAARIDLPPGSAVAFEVDPGPPPDGREVTKQVMEAFFLTRGSREATVEPLKEALAEQLAAAGYRVVSPAEAALVITVRPTRWKFQADPQQLLIGGSGRLDAKVEVKDPRTPNAPPVFTESYWATQSVGVEGEPVALRRTAARVVNMILQETQPGTMTAVVVLDESDSVVRTGVELARDNQFKAAYEAFAAAVTSAPDSPAAHYNFGVMAEIQRLYDIAENSVRKAIALEQKPLYFTALERIRQARADAEKLAAQQQPLPQPAPPAQ